MVEESGLYLAPRNDMAELQNAYERAGRVHIRGVLKQLSADAIYGCLADQPQWNLVYNKGGEHVDMDATAVSKWPRAKRKKLEKAIHLLARDAFQYHYMAIPIYDVYHKELLPGHFLNKVFEFLNDAKMLDFVRSITGDDSIGFADAQATCYRKGHFLTRHDDDVADKNRRVAYVLNLTPRWRPDWGGALQFFDSQGNIEIAYSPAYNVLNLFRVPMVHSVGIIAPFSGADRFAITGWFRKGTDPLAL